MSGQEGIRLRIALLGGCAVRDGDGLAITIGSRKAQALLAILALSASKQQPRDKLMGLLWGDRGEPQARSSLRQALTELRRALPDLDPPLIMTERDKVWLNPGPVEVDTARFDNLIDEGSPDALAAASQLYGGDLLDGLDVRDETFVAWLRMEREHYRERAVEGLRRLMEQQAGGDLIATAQRLLTLDPLDEATHRTLIRAYGQCGDRGAAIKQYEACRLALDGALGLKPDGQTERLVADIRAGKTGEAQGTADPVPAHAQAHEKIDEPPLPDKPSIAVLPFINMSGDPEQAFFTEGITEDIVTALSRISGLFVVASHSMTPYQGEAVDVKSVGREQGVRHVLEGSVRKVGDQIRVTAQLVDAATGDHQWAEHYDRMVDDIFNVQDDITKKVTTELNIRLARGEEARVWARGTSNIEAWERVTKAWPLTDSHIKEHIVEARRLAGEAADLDPAYSTPWVILGWTHWEEALWGWGKSRDYSIERALSCAHQALECDAQNPDALVLLGGIHMMKKNTAKAIELGEQAIALSPNHASNIALTAMTMIFGGEPIKGLSLMQRAMRLCPLYPRWYATMVGVVHHIAGEQDKAIGIFRECVAKEPGTNFHRVLLVSALIGAKQNEEAKELAVEILEFDPDFKASILVDGLSADVCLTHLLLTNLAKAGLAD